MNGNVVLIAMLLPVLAGFESYTRPLGYTNSIIADAKQGQDCRVLVFGLGGMADVTGTQAIRLGGITKLQSAEYRVNTLEGVGSECVADTVWWSCHHMVTEVMYVAARGHSCGHNPDESESIHHFPKEPSTYADI